MRSHTPTLAVPDPIRDPAAFPQAPERAKAHIDPGLHRGERGGGRRSIQHKGPSPLIRPFAIAKAHLLPRGEKGRKDSCETVK